MEEKYLNKTAEEIKEVFIQFYQLHQKQCDSLYSKAVCELEIYQEITDLQQINNLFLKTSLVLLTANVFEKNLLHLNAISDTKQKIIHCIVNSSKNPRRPLNVNVFFFRVGDVFVLHMEANQAGSYSMGGSADLIRFVMDNPYCFPSAILSYGICFGNDYQECQLGDTIIAKKLYPYFMSAKVKEDSFYVEDSNIFEIDAQLDVKIRYLIGKGDLSEKKRIFYGNMVTGEAVVSNQMMKNIFIKAATNQPILGGEMEGYGLFKECQGFERSIPCLTIKSICDWGAYKNLDDDEFVLLNLKDKIQAYAADQACKVLFILLKNEYPVFRPSVYEQVKRSILQSELQGVKEDMIIYAQVIEILEKYGDSKLNSGGYEFLCDAILKILEEEKIIERIKGGVYWIRGGQ